MASTLSTAQEFIDTYYDKLKTELNARGLQISKVGLIGLILHILGFSQQDIKLYYDTLFREAFVATSDKYENLVMHGSVFGYTPGLSSPASLTGNISFDTSVLPVSTSSNKTITLTGLQLKLDNFVYTLESSYLFKNAMCQIIDTNGNVTTVPVSTTNPLVPIQNFKQYEEEEYAYTIPFYVYNSYYSLVIDMKTADDVYICDLEVSIQENGSDVYIPYEYKLVNYSSSSNDRHVFVQFLPNGKLLIELGSGVHGKYIPNSFVNVKVKTTYGEAGNISKQTLIPFAGTLRIYDNDTSSSYTVNITSGVTVEVDYASGGTNQLLSTDLRSAILEFIRHRNNLLSETDFYDIVKKYFEDYELMFKKTHVMDNNIYLFTVFRDLYQLPVRSRSISVKHPEFNPSMKCFVYKPTFILENNIEYISPFLYVLDFTVRQYKAYIIKDLISAYFSNVVVEYTPETGNDIIALPLTFYSSYNPTLDNARFMVQSYESITDYVFLMDVPLLNISNYCLNIAADNIVDMYYYNTTEGTGIIFDKVDIILKVYKSGILYFTYTLNNFSMVSDISDILSLKTFDGFVVDYYDESTSSLTDTIQQQVASSFNKDSYVLNIPVMQTATYEEDSDYYLTKFTDTFGSLAFEENRMISDDVQLRFINTDAILAEQVKASTKQAHNINLKFPLHLSIRIVAYQKYILENNIDTIVEKQTLLETLAQTLFDKYTGTSVSFYQTQIIEIVHDLKWVKYCTVTITDDTGLNIPDNNIELLSQANIINSLDKLGAVTYCPFYLWWNLDNIEITINYEL